MSTDTASNVGSEPSNPTKSRVSAQVSVTVEHPKLTKADPESIRQFLSLYDQYVNEVQARARQLGIVVTDGAASRPVDLKFCVDIEFLKSALALGMIEDADSYETLSDTTLRSYLNTEASESQYYVTLPGLDSIVKRELKMDMKTPTHLQG